MSQVSKFTPEIREQGRQWREDGHTQTQMADWWGLSVKTINHWFRRGWFDESPKQSLVLPAQEPNGILPSKRSLTDEAVAIQEGYLELAARLTDIIPGLKALALLEKALNEGTNLNVRLGNVKRERDELQGRLTQRAMAVHGD